MGLLYSKLDSKILKAKAKSMSEKKNLKFFRLVSTSLNPNLKRKNLTDSNLRRRNKQNSKRGLKQQLKNKLRPKRRLILKTNSSRPKKTT